jgi:hypothetical protein
MDAIMDTRPAEGKRVIFPSIVDFFDAAPKPGKRPQANVAMTGFPEASAVTMRI